MSQQAVQFFENLWQDYLSKTPSAAKVHQVLGGGAEIINDHVAFRTFNIAPVRLDKLAELLESMGYFANGDYHFEAKKLRAKHYEHHNKDLPKIFISELLVEELSEDAQKIIADLVASINPHEVEKTEFLFSGTHWKVTKAQYDRLLEESEYAAWTSAFGFCANHFTVSINRLEGYDSIEQVNQKLKDEGFKLNASGGEVKGTPEVFLEQSSTMADHIPVQFADIKAEIPSCFYEFAKRYEMPNGEIYTGFVAASADKIFESTNAS